MGKTVLLPYFDPQRIPPIKPKLEPSCSMLNLSHRDKTLFFDDFYFVHVHTPVCAMCVSVCVHSECGGERTTWWSQFTPLTLTLSFRDQTQVITLGSKHLTSCAIPLGQD